MTRIAIVDRYDIVRDGVRSILSDDPDWEIVGEAADGREAVRQAAKQKPDLLITGYSVPLINGVQITRQVLCRCPETKVLLFTQHQDEAVIKEALRAGVLGFVLKSEPNLILRTAITSLCTGRPFFSAIVHRLLLQSFLAEDEPQVLTPREKSVLQLIAEGHTNKRIANILGVSTKTIETHRAATHRKLQINSTASLVRYAIRNNFLPA
jgi:DNA-binding NarL/FixJ family response regulator